MIEISEIPDRTFEDRDISNSAEKTAVGLEKLNDYTKDHVADAGKQEYKAETDNLKANVVSDSLDLLEKIASKVEVKIPKDGGELEKLNDTSAEVASSNFADQTSIDNAKLADANVPAETKELIEKVLNNRAGSLDAKLDLLLSPETAKVKAEEGVKVDNLMKDLAKELEKPKPDNSVIQQKLKEMDASNKKFSDALSKELNLKEETIAKGGSKAWDTLVNGALFLLKIAALGGLLWAALALLSKALSGCYMYYNNEDGSVDKTKLQGCSDYYSKPENNQLCSCGALVPIGTTPTTDTICNAFTVAEEKTKPYCIGVGSDTTIQSCSGFPNGQRLQCAGTLNVKGYVYYAYQDYPPLGIISAIVNAVENAPGDIANDLSALFKKILLYGGIILGVLILLAIIYKWITYKSSETSTTAQIAAPKTAT